MSDGGGCGCGSGGCGGAAVSEETAVHPHEELIVKYLRGVENFDPRLFELSDEQNDTAFAEADGVGLWPVRVLLGHLADAEMVFTHRIRRAIAEENPVLALWDENAFVDGGIYGAELRPPVAGFVAAIHTMRRWTAELLMSLSESQWERRVMHPERGEMTVKELVELTSWHLEHHNEFLQKKINHYLGEAPESGCCGGGGGGCGCESGEG